ncbi:DNA-directed RNA polymerase III core subunit ret1 [Rhizophlyctis rosea]|uniref:DNA-directed RNA polymerase n=1 Tax=Rhizophlyctis rosea TaxID=64517 RepID=A0AAD5WZL2_9FUNG|nr:DNA-directed RNA polymerase III core subunit ret1 [Rhizophlyctis rosea]
MLTASPFKKPAAPAEVNKSSLSSKPPAKSGCIPVHQNAIKVENTAFIPQLQTLPTNPILSNDDKWRMIPSFLETRGLLQQHITSFDHFIDSEMPKIMMANGTIDSDVDPSFFLKFTKIQVQPPSAYDAFAGISSPTTPHQCRVRDTTYAGRIAVDILYRRGHQVVHKKGLEVGWMPIMLRSKRCILHGATPQRCVELDECPLDPGGYFIIHGVEKIILIQEQLSKNRIIIEEDTNGAIGASVHSATDVKRSKTNVVYSRKVLVLKHNSLTVDIDVCIAMGVQSDREISELICGSSPTLLSLFSLTLLTTPPSIRTQSEALHFIGTKVKVHMRSHRGPTGPGMRRSPTDDARDLLADTVLAHVPVEEGSGEILYRSKAVYLGYMARRVLMAVESGGVVDDRDFAGNKRLELSGQLLTILYEDLFKSWTSTIKRTIDQNLKRKNRVSQYDAATAVTQTSRFVTDGLVRSLGTGNWRVKRFKMDRAGITQVLTRLSYASAVGCLARVASQASCQSRGLWVLCRILMGRCQVRKVAEG